MNKKFATAQNFKESQWKQGHNKINRQKTEKNKMAKRRVKKSPFLLPYYFVYMIQEICFSDCSSEFFSNKKELKRPDSMRLQSF